MKNVPPSVRVALKKRGADSILNQEGDYYDFKPQIDAIIHKDEDMSGYMGDMEPMDIEDMEEELSPAEKKANDRIEELGDKYKIYQYPSDLSEDDIKKAKEFGLEYLGDVDEDGIGVGDKVIRGKYSDLDRFNKEHLGYEFNEDYLYDDGDFNTDVIKKNPSKEDTISSYFGKKVKEGYADGIYEVAGGEYFIGTQDEAYEEAKNQVNMTIDDLGLQAFTPSFQERILDEFVDEEFFNELKEEDADNLESDGDTETAEYFRNMSADEYKEELRMNYGDEGFFNLVKDHIDWDAVADEAIKVDGIAHFVAGYDGEEVDLGNGLYAYKLNDSDFDEDLDSDEDEVNYNVRIKNPDSPEEYKEKYGEDAPANYPFGWTTKEQWERFRKQADNPYWLNWKELVENTHEEEKEAIIDSDEAKPESKYNKLEKELLDKKTQLKELKSQLKTASEDEKEKILDSIDIYQNDVNNIEGELSEIRYIDNGNANDYSGYDKPQSDDDLSDKQISELQKYADRYETSIDDIKQEVRNRTQKYLSDGVYSNKADATNAAIDNTIDDIVMNYGLPRNQQTKNWYDGLSDESPHARDYKEDAMNVNPERAALISKVLDEYVSEKPQRGFITNEQLKKYGERLGLDKLSDRDLRTMWSDVHNVAGYKAFGTPYDKGGRELEDAQSAFAEVVNQEARNRKAKGNYFPYDESDIDNAKSRIREIIGPHEGYDLDNAMGYLSGKELGEIERIANEYHLSDDDLASISHNFFGDMGYTGRGWKNPEDAKTVSDFRKMVKDNWHNDAEMENLAKLSDKQILNLMKGIKNLEKLWSKK